MMLLQPSRGTAWPPSRLRFWPSIVALACGLIMSTPSAWAASPVGDFEDHGDVGSPKLPGSAAYDADAQEYSLSAAGFNMWGVRDEFHFAWKKLRGDFILQARVSLVGTGVDPHRKLGWMGRSSLDADAPYADAAIHGDGLTSLQYRRAKGAITEQVQSTVKGPDFVQLERRGDRYILSAARFGEIPTACELTNLVLGDEPYIGLFLCSHNSNVTEKAVFRDVRIVRPAKPDFVPYKDYIGSILEMLDVESGSRKTLASSQKPFEAPNWTPDGNALIYNTSGRDANHRGRIQRFDLRTRKIETIDTGFAVRNNNDHVLSFDGTQLGISNHATTTNQGSGSAIYVLPTQGGVPRPVTTNIPSYLHGWSPDGKFLVFTGGRNGDYDIYKIPVQGGDEVRLTDAKGLDDGPEYSPDGKYIYFNSSRTGAMQLWRMNPDGSGQEQITHDDLNNWFPHISPDGRWIAFVTFPKDVSPTDHPYYKQVLIRLMPTGGGEPKVVAYVYGGQGTMNVPSWSPNSKRLAFVSNSNLE